MKKKLRSIFFKIWYWYISTIDKNAEVIFMNYGYSKNNQKIVLKEEDEKNRYSIQLYNHTVEGVDIKAKNILEVGCGRGGGLSYINSYFSPNKVTGIDLNKKAIDFCNKFYSKSNSVFIQADAQDLPFSESSFDIVINVESSHRYPKVELFINEVYRVLKPGGVLLLTDFGQNKNLKILEKYMVNAGFNIQKKEDITNEIIEALNLSTPDRKILIDKIVPNYLKNIAHQFAATEGSKTYKQFSSRHFEYVYYILKKQ